MTKPDLAVSFSRAYDSDLVLQVHRNARVTAVSDIAFWKENAKEYLWRLSVRDAAQDMRIMYGVVPDETQGRIMQVFPAQGKPGPLMPGDVLLVSVTYYYDSSFSACCSTKAYKFQVSEDRSLESLGSVSSYRIPEDFQGTQ